MNNIIKKIGNTQKFLDKGKYIIDWDKPVIVVDSNKKSILRR